MFLILWASKMTNEVRADHPCLNLRSATIFLKPELIKPVYQGWGLSTNSSIFKDIEHGTEDIVRINVFWMSSFSWSFQILADQIELLPRNIALVMMTKMLHMITNFFDSSLSNYLVKIKDTKQLLRGGRVLSGMGRQWHRKVVIVWSKSWSGFAYFGWMNNEVFGPGGPWVFVSPNHNRTVETRFSTN